MQVLTQLVVRLFVYLVLLELGAARLDSQLLHVQELCLALQVNMLSAVQSLMMLIIQPRVEHAAEDIILQQGL